MEKYIVVFGGCSLDYIYKQRQDLSYPEKPDAVLPGGKGANQAVAMARAGDFKVKIISVVGNDEAGKKIVQNLEDNEVETQFVKKISGVESDRCDIYVALNGEKEMKRHNDAIGQFDASLINENKEIIRQAEFVVVPAKMSKEVYTKLINFCYENGVKIVLTPCNAQELKFDEDDNEELLKKATFITANREESRVVCDTYSVYDSIRMFPNLIITSNEEGAYFYDENDIRQVPAITFEEVVDTTGAGDTLCGNFVVALMKGYSLLDSVKIGVLSAGLKLEKLGAQDGMPYKVEMQKRPEY